MNIHTTQVDNITAVAVKGRVDSVSSDGLGDRLGGLIRCDSPRLAINLKDVDYISSTGLRVLLIAARAVEQAGGRMVLCGMPKEIQRLFDIAGFSELFTILPTQDEAIRALR